MVAANIPLSAELWTHEPSGAPAWRLRQQSLAGRFAGLAGAAALIAGLASTGAASWSRDISDSLTPSLLSGVAVAGLAYWAARSFAQHVIGPLKDIAEATQTVSIRNFAANLKVASGDELEAVALAVNRMVRRLELNVAQLRRKAETDPLTGLPVRAAFVRDLAQAWGAGQPQGCLVVCDLARFAQINEAAGCKAGNEILAVTAARIADVLRRVDLSAGESCVARLNADQFAVFAPGIDSAEGAALLMQALIEAIGAPATAEGRRFVLSASAGAVLCGPGDADVERQIGRAQAALKRGRQEGPGLGRLWAPDLNKRPGHSFAAEAAILDAIDKKHIVPFFQPKVDLTSGKITSVEALARWVVPGRGVIEPGRFIPAAENLGLISAIGETILRQACFAAADWRQRGLRCRVAVNVAPAQFDDPSFSDMVLAILADARLPADFLELEITESTAMKNINAALKQIAPLRRAGVRLSLDDFGAGHSSLAMLTQMPFDVFKIDRQFVAALDTDEQAGAVVDTILSLGRSLNFEIVAEGIENVRQEAFLRKRGCTLGQGYLYGAPMPVDEFVELAQGSGRRALRAVS